MFDPTITPALVAALHRVLRGTTCIALLALTVRNATTIAEFLNIASKFSIFDFATVIFTSAAGQRLAVEQVPYNTKDTIFAGTSGNYTMHEVQIFQFACNPTVNK